MSSNIENYFLDNAKATAPQNEAGTGTIQTIGLGVKGTGTAFKTQLARGAYIVDLTANEFRMVVEVVSDTYAILESAFSADIPAATALNYIPAWKGNVREIAAIIPVYQQDNTTENAWGSIGGEVFPPGVGFNVSKANRDKSSSMDMIKPVIMDATGTQIRVTLTY